MAEGVDPAALALLKTPAHCRHCDGSADLVYVDKQDAAQVCPGRYVTRVIRYGQDVDAERFSEHIRKVTSGLGTVEPADIRVASRYAWDLGLRRRSNDLVLREAYWTQSYRRTKDDSPDRSALFLCSNSDSFYVQPLNGTETLCPNCRG